MPVSNPAQPFTAIPTAQLPTIETSVDPRAGSPERKVINLIYQRCLNQQSELNYHEAKAQHEAQEHSALLHATTESAIQQHHHLMEQQHLHMEEEMSARVSKLEAQANEKFKDYVARTQHSQESLQNEVLEATNYANELNVQSRRAHQRLSTCLLYTSPSPRD